MDLQTLQDGVTAFASEREWEAFHDVKNLSMALASEVGELNAILRWVRSEHVDHALSEQATRSALRAEIGDVGIVLLLLCARSGIGLEEAVLEKLRTNALKYPVAQSRGRAEAPRADPG